MDSLPHDPRALVTQQMQRLEDISLAAMVMACQIETQAQEANFVGSGGDLMFARNARALRQTIAMEMNISPGGDPDLTSRQMKKLGAVADVGVSLIVVLRTQVVKARWHSPEEALMFARIARAVRQTQAMETRVDADGRLSDEERAAVRARRAKSRVRRQEVPEDELSDAEGLNGDCHEQLDDRTIDAELAGRSVLEVVAAALKDLGIADPDLTVFAEPASALTPALSRDAGEGAVAVAAGGMPLAPVAGEGGARRDGDGRVRPQGHDPP